MLKINSLTEFRARVRHKEEIRELNLGHGVVSFCYLLAADNTFDDAWARECRGICFDEASGNVIGRPLHKFFNVNEREATRAENIDWATATRLMDKRDGSMIHTVLTRDGVRFKSKKSFNSEVARAASAWVEAEAGQGTWRLATELARQGCTAIFEWTSPDARIVLAYPQAELRLLHIRENVSGRYLSGAEVKAWAAAFGVQTVNDVDEFWYPDAHLEAFGAGEWKVEVSTLLEAAKAREGIEGWVVQFENGDMVKLKTEWYLKRHRAMTFLRERDVAQLVLDEGLDDLKSLLVGAGVDISELLATEARVLRDLRELALEVDSAVREDQHLDRKSFAIKHQGTATFGLKMTRYLGKEPNFKEYFERNLLKARYDLRQLRLVDSVAELE